jgi:pimeloyl-ACP methyl ester carboxylesterase
VVASLASELPDPWSPYRMPIQVREYGTSGSLIVLLHGGPGAPGYMAPVARALADTFRVVEPLQRGSGAVPLTVASHIQDLHEIMEARSLHHGNRPSSERSSAPQERPALAGHSWGAMLALAYAAAHPDSVSSIALISCGTFDPAARARLEAIREERMDAALRRRLNALADEIPDPDKRLRVWAELTLPIYSHDPVEGDLELVDCDMRAFQESWGDMVRLQNEGVYPAAFASIRAPVLMLHGVADPHPGAMVRSSLEPYLKTLVYREWERCGHYPWMERAVRDEFFDELRRWLLKT